MKCKIDGCDRRALSKGYCEPHYRRNKKHGDATKLVRFSNPEEAFEVRTMWEPMSGCLLWIGSVTRSGYGKTFVNGENMQAHRYAWVRKNGPIPKGEGYHGLCVLHRCDNPACVNVGHLFLGTHKANMNDMKIKGRCKPPKGSKQGLSKLTEADIPNIRKDTRSHQKIANDYGVAKATIGRAKSRESWGHIK